MLTFSEAVGGSDYAASSRTVRARGTGKHAKGDGLGICLEGLKRTKKKKKTLAG